MFLVLGAIINFSLTSCKAAVILLTMTSKIVTVTSKNQITLPADLVRKYKLDKNRILTITDKKGALELRPQATLEERMRPHGEEFKRTHPNFKPPTEDKIHEEVSDTYANYFNHGRQS